MRLLQVVLAAGLLASFAAAGPLFSLNDDDEYYYDYEDYYDDESQGTAVEPETKPAEDGTPEKAHSHHHHSHHSHHSNHQHEEAEQEVTAEEMTGNDLGSPEEVVPENEREHDSRHGAPTMREEVAVKPVAHGVIPIAKIPKGCTQPPDPGVCRGSFPKFYYDPESRRCLQFVYGGCRGNANVFHTAKECYEKCDPVGFTRTGGTAKDDYLTLHDGAGKNEFTFRHQDAAIRVNDATLAQFSVRNVYQLEFMFRTDAPHGLIAFLRQTSVPPELGNKMVQLYVFIRRGRLGVTHIFCHNSETFLMKRGGVQAGNWHSSMVKVNAGTGQLLLEVDGTQETFTIASLRDKPHYGSLEGAVFTSRLWIGGVFEEEVRREEMVGRIANFHGCMRKVGLMSGETSATMVRHKGLLSAVSRDVKEWCSKLCNSRRTNMCSNMLSCVEHFDHSTCSCFGTGKDGKRCEVPDVPILTLRNDGHVVHRLYEWMDRVQSYTNFISMEFRSHNTDSILFYASSQYPEKQYIAGTLTAAATVFVEANLGGGAVNIEVGERLDTGTWHTLTILHQHNRLQVHLNSRIYELLLPGEVRYFHLDPDFYIGSAPNLQRTCGLRHDRGMQEGHGCQGGEMRYYYDVHDAECHTFNYTGCGGNGNNFLTYSTCMNTCRLPGLRSMHSFLGCFRNIFINDVSVLWELKEKKKTTRYIGPTEETPFTDTCSDQMILLTLSTERAHVNLTNPRADSFKLVVSFRPTTPKGVVASGYVDTLDTRSEWEIHHDEKHVSFVIRNSTVHLKPNTKISIGNWQYVEVTYNKRLFMKVNQKSVSENPPGPLTFYPTVSLGLGPRDDYPGMIGCVRKVELGGEPVDLRSLVGTNVAHKDATYDGCRVLGPCERTGACEHGTTCSVGDDEEIRCNCTDSGYTGKTCHFSLYKSSCEEYRHMGYNTSGVYKIDVDGNGPLPPSFVRCEFNPVTGMTSTIVENNLRDKYEVRRPGLGNVKIDVQYRDFTPEMLQALVTRDETCTQKATYECRRSPLKLSTHTWFASPSDNYVTSFGSEIPGVCRCGEIGSCDKYNVACNCDAMDGLGRSDVAVFSDPQKLPLTSMIFLAYNKGQGEESQGSITLGPLICDKEAVAEQVVSFSKEDAYVEVPAWREGSLSFAFKTTSDRAVLAFQPAYHPDHATFRIALLGEREVEFMYSFHDLEHRHVLHTSRHLNTGKWQQILIEIHLHQLRFLVNSEQKLIDIEEDANLGVLDGSLFLGGIPDNKDIWKNQVTDADRMVSLRGCIRDLTINNEMLDFDRYVRAAPAGVSSSCEASCNPNPCKNGAKCVENWGSYSCVCKNPLAHSGDHCEKNPNEDAITFTTEASMLKYFVNESANLWSNTFLNSTSLLLNFRTHAQQGLILFTYDYLHNFLQLHLASPTRLVLLFNSGKEAVSLPIEITSGDSFNEGQSVQVAIERTASTTTLSVFTNGAQYVVTSYLGLELIQDIDYEQFPFGESTPLADMVYYPHSFTRPGQFYKAYLGSADDSQWDVRTDIPGIVGCIRGLQVDSSPMSLTGLLTKYPAEGVKKKCEMMCDRKPCLNGGVCKEDFLYPDSFRCDCSGTSYTGAVCSSETAYNFHGSEWLSRGSDVSPLVEGVVIELAFSASTRKEKPQIVALLRSTEPDHPLDYILVAVEPDGAVEVSAVIEPLVPFTRFVAHASPKDGVNAYSGLRHMIRVELQSDGPRVTVDKKELEVAQEPMPMTRTLVNPKPRGMYLGGLEEGVDERFSDYDNFYGCISNVQVTLPGSKVYPLQEYNDHDLHITNFGLPGYGSCAGFPATPVMVMAYHNRTDLEAVEGEAWHYREAQRMAFEAPAPLTAQPRNTPMDNVVPIVAGTIIVVTAVIVAVLCLKHQSYKKNKTKNRTEETPEQIKERERKDKLRREEAMMAKAAAAKATTVELEPLLPTPNGGTQDMIVKVNEEKEETVPLQDLPPSSPPPPPPPAPTEDAAEDKAEEQTQKETPGDRPLSWDKSADTLPLIIGTEQEKQQKEEDAGDSSSSASSSFECTIDITGSPASSPKLPPQPDSSVGEASPSSLRVQKGSNTVLNIDEDTDAENEPRLLRHKSLSGDDDSVQVEPPMTAKCIHPLGEGEVQKIEKSEAEDEIVVVDDYLENKETEKVQEPGSEEAVQEREEQKKEDLAEAAQENSQTDSDTEAKTDQSFESAKEEHDDAKENVEKETDKPVQESKLVDQTKEEGKKTETQTVGGEEAKQDGTLNDKRSSSESSDSDDFVEVRPEGEKVQDAKLVTSQTWQEESQNASTTTTTTTTTTSTTTTHDNQDDIPTDAIPIPISSDKGAEEEEKVMEKETAGEEVEGMTNEEEVIKDGKSPDNQTEEKDQEQKRSDSEGDKNDISDKVTKETQQEGIDGGAPISSVPEIVISSPKEELEGYLITQLQKAGEGEGGEGDVGVQDLQVTKDEDDKQDKESLESATEQEHSGILNEKKERGTDETEKDKEKEMSASEEKDPGKLSEGKDEAQTKQEDGVDSTKEEKSKENEGGLSKGRDLPPIDISQLEGHFQQSDKGPASPGAEEGEVESPTYLNYVQDDDVCLENLGTTVAKTSGNVTPLDPISEQDESEDEKDEDKTRKTSLPTLFKSKFSSGMDNLSALPGDEDNAAKDKPSADEAQNDKDDDNSSPDAGDENAAKAQSSSESEAEDDKEDKTTEATTPVASSAIAPDATKEEAANKDKGKRKRRRKKGKIIREPQSPIFIREGVRTFKNPVSYFGGPDIKYEDEGDGEEGGGGRRGSRQRNDSIASTTSLD